ncbi:Zn-ribbon domain-containing OB-fold protein [Rhodococcus sp. ACPA1]|jgi:uncharacterized OB-fold protein|uniref:Zn-ribbon domain-containing OB-fold protein n=1 Tax=Rhodococcus sp. ACPA1 TaxID=2028572 RepID=UPI000BB15255|nr:OB-fold domain-containing protein [Rhodococcus sp. ACPA1]PBC51512.1 hypothetical protein CJ177_34010 [Rhodococcus sp. ACPA1]
MHTQALRDPRPVARDTHGQWLVAGVRCTACEFASVLDTRRCPACTAAVAEQEFGPEATIWSHTVVRIPFNDRTPPYAIAYVDLDGGGARILVHLDEDGAVKPVRVGGRVRLTGKTGHGDLAAEVIS